MIIGWICIKIKFKDLIKFLIGQFDLIMGQVKF
jgi:hypothetical protein